MWIIWAVCEDLPECMVCLVAMQYFAKLQSNMLDIDTTVIWPSYLTIQLYWYSCVWISNTYISICVWASTASLKRWKCYHKMIAPVSFPSYMYTLLLLLCLWIHSWQLCLYYSFVVACSFNTFYIENIMHEVWKFLHSEECLYIYIIHTHSIWITCGLFFHCSVVWYTMGKARNPRQTLVSFMNKYFYALKYSQLNIQIIILVMITQYFLD